MHLLIFACCSLLCIGVAAQTPLGQRLIVEEKTPRGQNYCFNNPLLFIDPDGKAPRYNWQNGKYYDNGEEITWDEVQSRLKFGSHATFHSVMITQPYESDGTSVRNDKKKNLANEFGSNALKQTLEAAKKTNGTITIIHATNTTDAADQIEKLNYLIDNLIISSHGPVVLRQDAYFFIGDQSLNYSHIESDKGINRISKKMNVGSTVVMLVCGSGGLYNKGDLLLKAIAKKFNSVTYGPQGEYWGATNVFGGQGPGLQNKKVPNAPRYLENVQGLWNKVTPEGAVTPIKNVYFDAFGKTHFENN